MYRIPSLLTHALKQQISLPVARLLVLVRTTSQLFKLPTGRGLYDGLKRLDERFSSSLSEGPRLPRENLLRHLVDGLFCSHESSSPSASLLVGGRRNIVVTPGRAFKISGLIMLVLLCALPGIIEPGVGEIVGQTAFALSDVVDEGAQVGTAPTTGGRGAAAGSAKGHLLAALALECDCGRMPLVDLAKGHFAALVVCLDAFEDLHHRLLPLSLSPAVLSAGRSCPAALVSRVGSEPRSSGKAGRCPTPSRSALLATQRLHPTLRTGRAQRSIAVFITFFFVNFGELRQGEVRRTPLLQLYEKSSNSGEPPRHE